jgi:hypothetical protein
MTVQATENGWLKINQRSRGVELDSPVAGRFDVMQRWIAWCMAPARMAGLFPWSRANEARAAEPRVPEMVPAPDAPFTTAVADARHSVLVQNGEVVARLVEHPSNGVLTPYANRLTHYAYVPLPSLLDQLSRPAGSQGSVFPRAADEWGNRLRLPLAAQQLEAQRLRAAFRDLTGL